MTNPWAKVPLIAIAFMALSGVCNEAKAICTNKCQTGWTACLDWCSAHNKTRPKIAKCAMQCEKYWNSGANPQSIGPADPRKHPSGPAQVNPPPKAQ
jgi:hypothetical protein